MFTRFATLATRAAGSAPAFVLAASGCLAWLAAGPPAGWSDTWQLLINTPTTVLTFLLAFLILGQQNRTEAAINAKLDALLDAIEAAPSKLKRAEELELKEIEERRT